MRPRFFALCAGLLLGACGGGSTANPDGGTGGDGAPRPDSGPIVDSAGMTNPVCTAGSSPGTEPRIYPTNPRKSWGRFVGSTCGQDQRSRSTLGMRPVVPQS